MSARPATTSLRERKKTETRTAIHEAALRLVVENGVENTSVDAICSEAGVSSRTFFNYFPSKVSAIIGVDGFVVSPEARAEFLAGDGEHDLVPDLCRLVAGLTDLPSEKRRRHEALRDLLVRRPELVRDVFLLMADVRRQIAGLVAERTTERRARLATALVFAAVGAVMDDPTERDSVDLADWLLRTVEDMSGLVHDSLD
ncbi:TetR family transcriptional regulator [Cnuibacter sp. UC19_7]|uniref:TetR family transcriptional regulator n=1 Tax=Cnuibacter sp. UC19_7 TaxID=3350166 RepID=UPI003672E364